MTDLQALRREYHEEMCDQLIFARNGSQPRLADQDSRTSIALTRALITKLGCSRPAQRAKRRISQASFQQISKDYLEKALALVHHLRPGKWILSLKEDPLALRQYWHYPHFSELANLHPESMLQLNDHLLMPDILVGRLSPADDEIGTSPRVSTSSSTRLMLHASISCKLTLRSDRSQVARQEWPTLIRNRKGNTPHIVVITAEPLPSRIASLALGTGDIDCVYHFALHELDKAVEDSGDETLMEMLLTLVQGRRLRDISDLPFDLAV